MENDAIEKLRAEVRRRAGFTRGRDQLAFDCPDELKQRAKKAAARQGVTLRVWMHEAMREALNKEGQ